MDPNTTISKSKVNYNDLLNAQIHIWNHMFSFLHSAALKCAMQLQIPDTIHKHGEPMTLQDLANSIPLLHPNKALFLNRLVRLLVHSKFLFKKKLLNGEDAFGLTINSQLLLKDHPLTLAPYTLTLLEMNNSDDPSNHLSKWFRNDDVSPFHTALGKGNWEYASSVPEFNECFNEAMACDARFVSGILLGSDEFKGMLEGLGSLVDVGGGTGTFIKDIAKAYPTLKCTVLDLPHVVQGLQKNGTDVVEYVGGDMFKAVPPADAVILKWILHDWSDDDCVKILENCKESISRSRNGRGKVIIIDVVVDTQGDDTEKTNAQLLFDWEMLAVTTGGKERTEEEWKQLFVKAGFEYKIFPILGPRSVIEVYPA